MSDGAWSRRSGQLARLLVGISLLATAISQPVNPLLRKVRGWDVFRLVPAWNFFAPFPASFDFQIVYRVVGDGHAHPDITVQTSWEIAYAFQPRTIVNSIWHPNGRQTKAVFDLASELANNLTAGRQSVERLASFHILRDLVVGAINERIDSRGVNGFQFGIAKNSSVDPCAPLEVIYVSPYQTY